MHAIPKPRGDEENIQQSMTATLRELGLSSYAARSLVALLGNAPMSAGQICKASGIPDSKIYYALDELDRTKLVESQHGTPTLYKPVEFDQMISNLTRSEKEEHHRRLRLVELFGKQAEPLARARSKPAEIELAYIVKGRRNIVERMLSVIEQSRKELALLISSRELWKGIAKGLLQAKKRRVKIGIALGPDLKDADNSSPFGDVRVLGCECDILIADSEKLVTASNVDGDDAYAIVTSDESMIRMSREYFDNPRCCWRS
ncbi:TrmB family transcriptional regulator [[Eubacterium] cellulosolvens]